MMSLLSTYQNVVLIVLEVGTTDVYYPGGAPRLHWNCFVGIVERNLDSVGDGSLAVTLVLDNS